jgi:hypothetical protein
MNKDCQKQALKFSSGIEFSATVNAREKWIRVGEYFPGEHVHVATTSTVKCNGVKKMSTNTISHREGEPMEALQLKTQDTAGHSISQPYLCQRNHMAMSRQLRSVVLLKLERNSFMQKNACFAC